VSAAEQLDELVTGTRDAIAVRMSTPLLSFEHDDIEDLLRIALSAAVAIERAECAALCRQWQRENPECPETAEYIADAIEARK